MTTRLWSSVWGRRKQGGKIVTMNFRRANFSLFRDLLGRIPWNWGNWGNPMGLQETEV